MSSDPLLAYLVCSLASKLTELSCLLIIHDINSEM